MAIPASRQLAAEFLGAAFLLATVIGSGIMGERLAGGNAALALLGNTLATGAMLAVLITMFAPLSGAHFNPAVTAVLLMRGEIGAGLSLAYVAAQVTGALAGVIAAHLMFDSAAMQLSAKIRSGQGQWFSEFVATFGLLMTILLTLRARPDFVPVSVALYITAAYWFTASTSFANPAVALARGFSDSFAGIRLADVPAFVAAQFLGAFAAAFLCRWLVKKGGDDAR
jgi:glycerol uptake facilitator-like aquaporin